MHQGLSLAEEHDLNIKESLGVDQMSQWMLDRTKGPARELGRPGFEPQLQHALGVCS